MAGSCEKTPRLELIRGGTRLHQVHVQRVRRDGSAVDPPELDPRDIPPALMQDARNGWQRLLESEYESVVVSGWMTSALARLGVPLDILGAFGRVVEDEIRHVDVCADVLQRLGVNAVIPKDATPPVFAWKDDADADEQVIAGLVSFFCVGELMSAMEFRNALQMARLPLAQWAIGEIHRDEAFHGAFGFEAAKLFVPHWKPEAKARLVKRLQDELARFERRIGGPLNEDPRELTGKEKDLAELGLPPPPVMLGVFYGAVESQLLPRLADLGLEMNIGVGSVR
ncbi:MAG: ferritin-like domain-containing protein [Myxococcota bacterium]